MQAEALYAKQLERRSHYMLKAKGHMSADGTRRYLIPEPSAETSQLKQKPHPYTGKTVMMKLPTGKEAEKPNAGGLKHEQYFPYGTEPQRIAYGMRNGVESVNRNLKRSQYEDLANPDNSAVRGNTFTYLVAALAAVNENVRQILSFFKRKLALTVMHAKNQDVADTFWQSPHPDPASASARVDDPHPPGR